MDPQLGAILLGFAAVLAAVAQCIRELRRYHHAVDGKMDLLLAVTARRARAVGKLAGQAEVGKIPTQTDVILPSQRAGKLPHD